jgi:vancomycin permeability regulator SanA
LTIAVYSVLIAILPVSYDSVSSHSIGVVFGAGITKSGEPSTALKFRLDKSIDLYRDQKIRMIFVSGLTAEASVMKNYLVKKGIPAVNILSDENGETTFITVENVKRYIRIYNITDGAVFISQRYHIPRIMFIVRKLHIEGSEFIAAEPNRINILEGSLAILRETFAWLKNMFFDKEL